jgi:hypothetical protein
MLVAQKKKTPLRSRNSGDKKQVNSHAHDISDSDEDLEVRRLINMSYVHPDKTGKRGLYLKVMNIISVNFWLFFSK